MAQADLNIANQSGSAFRADLNNQLLALGTLMSGTSAPSTTYAYMLWADTTNGVLKIRNAANNAWITLQKLDGTQTLIGTSTALANAYAISTALTPALQIESANANGASLSITRHTSAAANLLLQRGVTGTPVADTEAVGQISFNGFDGTSYYNAALIRGVVEGAPSAGSMPGRLSLQTTPTGSTTPVERLRLDAAGQILAASLGTVSLPAWSFTGDPNTGIWSPGSDQLAVSTNGVERVEWGASETVFNDAGNDYDFRIEGDTNTSLFFIDASADKVGIGTSVPGQLLDIAASNNALTSTTANNTIRFTDTDVSTAADQPLGKIEWYTSDTTAPGAREVSYILSSAAGTAGGGDIRFGVSTNAGTVTEAMRIANGGLVTLAAGAGLSISSTSVTSPTAANGNVFSGTYTPTLTNTTNVASSTAVECQYIRVGNVVTVSGQVTFAATAANTDTDLGLSLPIASTFTANRQLGGAGGCASLGERGEPIALRADSTNSRAEILARPTVTTSQVYNFSFTYQVI